MCARARVCLGAFLILVSIPNAFPMFLLTILIYKKQLSLLHSVLVSNKIQYCQQTAVS